MQYSYKEFDKDKHDFWKALMLDNPNATQLVTPLIEIDRITYSEREVEIRRNKTDYRGDLMICSSGNKKVSGMENNVSLGLVELYDIKSIEDLEKEDWDKLRMPDNQKSRIKKGYVWFFRNPRRVIEFPVINKLGLFNLVYKKDTIIEYPKVVKLDINSYNLINGAKKD